MILIVFYPGDIHSATVICRLYVRIISYSIMEIFIIVSLSVDVDPSLPRGELVLWQPSEDMTFRLNTRVSSVSLWWSRYPSPIAPELTLRLIWPLLDASYVTSAGWGALDAAESGLLPGLTGLTSLEKEPTSDFEWRRMFQKQRDHLRGVPRWEESPGQTLINSQSREE